MAYTAGDLAEKLNGQLVGPADLTVAGVNFITEASETELTFIGGRKFVKHWEGSNARVTLISEGIDFEPGEGRAAIVVGDADLAMATALEIFAPPPPAYEPGVHPAAVVDPSAEIGEGSFIGPCCVVGPRVKIGAGTVLYANVTIMEDTVIGPGCTFWPGVVIRERCQVGAGCILHLNVSIGADGFGYRPDPEIGLRKIPQIGNVVLGNAVELGAGTTVDRGKFGSTVIGDGTKIDNLCQVGHNCRLGRCCVVAAASAIAGSVTMGDGIQMGGCVAVRDHLTIGDGARIGGGSGLVRDVPAGGAVLGYPAIDSRDCLRSWAALAKLPDFMRAQDKKSTD